MDDKQDEHRHERPDARPDEQLGRPDGHRYEAPESDEDRVSKEWAYAALGLLVVVLLVLIATGKVPMFGA